MSTVPRPTLGLNGFVAPDAAAILAAVCNDMNAAYGGGLTLDPNDPASLATPQGILAQSFTLAIEDEYNNFIFFVGQVDPRNAVGTMQDALGYLYFQIRFPAEATRVPVVLGGLAGTVVGSGAMAKDSSGNIYSIVNAVTIGGSGEVAALADNIVTGPIPCGTGALNQIYVATPGWDTIQNVGAEFTGSTAGSLLTVTVMAAGSLGATQFLQQAEIPSGTTILSQASGTPGGIGTYNLSASVPTVASTEMSTSSDPSVPPAGVLGQNVESAQSFEFRRQASVSLNASGSLAAVYSAVFASGAALTPPNLPADVYGAENRTGSPIVVGGVTLSPHSIYIAAVGGDDTSIAQAILSRKDTGCDLNGNTTVIVPDPGPPDHPYALPVPTYSVTFERPSTLPIYFVVNIINSPNLPSNIVALIQAALVAASIGLDGGQPMRIGSAILASRYYSDVIGVAPSVQLLSLFVGTAPGPTGTSVAVDIDQYGVTDAAHIVVNLV